MVNNDEIVLGLHPQLGDECQSLTLGWDLLSLATNSIFQFAFSMNSLRICLEGKSMTLHLGEY